MKNTARRRKGRKRMIAIIFFTGMLAGFVVGGAVGLIIDFFKEDE